MGSEQNARRAWIGNDDLMLRYHGEERGIPVHEDRKRFEFIILDALLTVLVWNELLTNTENLVPTEELNNVLIAGLRARDCRGTAEPR